MTQQQTETQLTEEAISNIERVIQFLNDSPKYKHQAALINKLRQLVDKVQQRMARDENVLQSKGHTTAERTVACLKIALLRVRLTSGVASPHGGASAASGGAAAASASSDETMDEKEVNEEKDAKAMFIDDCLEYLCLYPKAHIPEAVVAGVLSNYLTDADRTNLAKASPRLFKAVWTTQRLLSAVFMGEEDIAAEIVRINPELLFTSGTYSMPLLNEDGMPLLNEDGTPAQTSEQIYHDVTPLQLMLYTGDWKMWERIFPLIPEAKLEETFQKMCIIPLGGPDLVKIDRDPTTLTVAELRHYQVKDTRGREIRDEQGKPEIYDLLGNPDGVFYVESGDEARFFYVNPETEPVTVIRLPDPDPTQMTPENQAAFNQFKASIRNGIAMNSSLRTSDTQHQLIARLFRYHNDFPDPAKAGQPVTLHREGIHYELNGTHYRDTYDGCIRLKNAYRRYIEIYDAHQAGTPWDDVDTAWRQVVGMAQRLSMVHVIQRFCEEDKPFYPLPNKDDLKSRKFIRTDKVERWGPNTQNIYPVRLNSGVGFYFGLYKGVMHGARSRGTCGGAWAWAVLSAAFDVAAVRLIDEVRKACFNEQMQKLDRKLHPSSDRSSGPGCVVM